MRFFAFAAALWLGAGLGYANSTVRRPQAAGLTPAADSISGLTAQPSSVSFMASDPDAAPPAVPVTLTWHGHGDGPDFIVTVQAGAASFDNCGTVPASAVTVTCTNVDGRNGGTCMPPFHLSAFPQVVATGGQAPGNRSYNVSINFTFSDSWRFQAALNPLCSLTLNYVVNAP